MHSSEGDGLGFNSIKNGKLDRHVIIKKTSNFSLTSNGTRGGEEREGDANGTKLRSGDKQRRKVTRGTRGTRGRRWVWLSYSDLR